MSVLVYGATGYTGELVARHARDAGLDVVVAGRRPGPLQAVAGELGLPARTFGLDDPEGLRAGLDGVTAVLNAAGPFEVTAPPLLDACLAAGIHYLDLAGEVPAVAAAAARHDAAVAAGVTVLPAVGFGVVATDLAAAVAASELDAPVELDIAFRTVGGVSRGTASVLLPTLHHAGVRRQDGQLVPARPASRSLRVDLGSGPRTVVLNPWRADIVTAARTTGAATVTTYQDLPAPLRALMRSGPRVRRLLDTAAWQRLVATLVRRLPDGPGPTQLAAGYVEVWARATDAAGHSAAVTLRGPEAYLFTARSAAAVLVGIDAGGTPAGYHTPVGLFGTELADRIEGVRIATAPA